MLIADPGEWAKTLDMWVAAGEVTTSSAQACGGRIKRFSFLDVDILEVWSNEQEIHHRKQHLIGQKPHCLLTLQLSGTSSVTQGARTAHLAPGEFCLRNMSRPSSVKSSHECSRLLVRTPLDRVGSRALLDRSSAISMSGSIGPTAAISDFFRSLYLQLDSTSYETAAGVGLAVRELVAFAMRNSGIPEMSKSERRRTGLMARIEDFVELHLSDPDLNVAMVSDGLQISSRHLQRMFSDADGGIARYILGRRLNKCRDALRDETSRNDTIADICLHWGFRDPTHFSRSFKRHYGVSPRAYRRDMRDNYSGR